MSDVNSFTNLGICYLNQPAAPPSAPRTLILTGLARSGTSMLAQAVRAAGIPIGATANNVVREDTEIAAALDVGDFAKLDALVAARDAAHQVWGFKRPNLHAMLGPADLRRFVVEQGLQILRQGHGGSDQVGKRADLFGRGR